MMENVLFEHMIDMLEEKVECREMWKVNVPFSPTAEHRVAELTVEIDLLKTLLKCVR